MWNSAEHNFFSDLHWEPLNKLTGELIALMTAFISPGSCAIPDGAALAVIKWIFGQASLTLNIPGGNILGTGQGALKNPDKRLLEFLVIVPGCNENTANSAIIAAWTYQLGIDTHDAPPASDENM